MFHLIHQHLYLSLAYLFIGLMDLWNQYDATAAKLKTAALRVKILGTFIAGLAVVPMWPLWILIRITRRTLRAI